MLVVPVTLEEAVAFCRAPVEEEDMLVRQVHQEEEDILPEGNSDLRQKIQKILVHVLLKQLDLLMLVFPLLPY